MATEIKKLDLSKIQARTNSVVEMSNDQIDVFNNEQMYNNNGIDRSSKEIAEPKLKTKRTYLLKKLNPKWQTMKSPDEEEMIILSQPESQGNIPQQSQMNLDSSMSKSNMSFDTSKMSFNQIKAQQQRQKSRKLKIALKEGLLPDYLTDNFDMDRLYEDQEDFLATDRRKPLALNTDLLKPQQDPVLKTVVPRSILGDQKMFEIGQEINVAREQILHDQLNMKHKCKKKKNTNFKIGKLQQSSKMLEFSVRSRSQLSGHGVVSPVGSSKFQTTPFKGNTVLENKLRTVQFDGKKETAAFGKLETSLGDISITNSRLGTKSGNKPSFRNKSHGIGGMNFQSYGIKQYTSHIDKHKKRQLLDNSRNLDDQQLQKFLNNMKIRTSDFELRAQDQRAQTSMNLNFIKDRDTKQLKNFDKYQQIWQKNLIEIEAKRDRMNKSALCDNYKANREQTKKGDISILERIEFHNEKKKNQELINVAFRPSHSHGVDWQCSLREIEHDTEYDGILQLQQQFDEKSTPMAMDQTLSGNTIEIGQTNRNSDSMSASVGSNRRDQMSQLSNLTAHQKSHKFANKTFRKKRFTYDQKFISEEDHPLQKRRVHMSYVPIFQANNGMAQSSGDKSVIPQQFGKFLVSSRLPYICQEIQQKPSQFKIRNFVSLTKNSSLNKDQSFRDTREFVLNDRFNEIITRDLDQSNIRVDTAGTIGELQTPGFNRMSDRFNDYSTQREPLQSVDESRVQKHRNAVSMMTHYALDTQMGNQDSNRANSTQKMSTINISEPLIDIDDSAIYNFGKTSTMGFSSANTTHMNWSQQQSKLTNLQSNFHKNFMQKAKKEHFDLVGLKELLPCSLEAVDNCGEMIVEGKNKLIEEVRYAQSIPSSRRQMIDKIYIDMLEAQASPSINLVSNNQQYVFKTQGIGETTQIDVDEVIAQSYDYQKLYLK